MLLEQKVASNAVVTKVPGLRVGLGRGIGAAGRERRRSAARAVRRMVRARLRRGREERGRVDEVPVGAVRRDAEEVRDQVGRVRVELGVLCGRIAVAHDEHVDAIARVRGRRGPKLHLRRKAGQRQAGVRGERVEVELRVAEGGFARLSAVAADRKGEPAPLDHGHADHESAASRSAEGGPRCRRPGRPRRREARRASTAAPRRRPRTRALLRRRTSARAPARRLAPDGRGAMRPPRGSATATRRTVPRSDASAAARPRRRRSRKRRIGRRRRPAPPRRAVGRKSARRDRGRPETEGRNSCGDAWFTSLSVDAIYVRRRAPATRTARLECRGADGRGGIHG